MKKNAKHLLAFLTVFMVVCLVLLTGCQPNQSDPNDNPTPEQPNPNFDEATGLNFKLSDNGLYYIVIKSPECKLDLTIPEKFNGIPVREIADAAFYGMELTNVVIPPTVDIIGRRAFMGCAHLTEIVIPDSVDVIEDYAFASSSISSITIGNNVKRIGYYAFSSCYALEAVTIPDSVTVICDGAFEVCGSLSSVVFGNGVECIGSKAFVDCIRLGRITVGSGLKLVGNEAFSGCNVSDIYINDLAAWCGIEGLENMMNYPGKFIFVNNEPVTQIEIPHGVTEIKEYAFHNCAEINWVTIPNTVEKIGEHAFTDCPELGGTLDTDTGLLYLGNVANPYLYLLSTGTKELSIQPVIKSECKLVSPHAFEGCDKLVTKDEAGARYIGTSNNPYFYLVGATSQSVGSITINPWCKFIAANAFRNCSSIKSVTIPDGIDTIPSNAFDGCTSLNKITLPTSVTYIGDTAFRACKALTSFVIPSGVTEINNFTFSECSTLAEVTIHEAVTGIGRCAFQSCYALSSIVIPDSVSYIYDSAFSNCSSLTEVTLPSSLTVISRALFTNCQALKSITLPVAVEVIKNYSLPYVEEITFEGTLAEWELVHKHDISSDIKVVCTGEGDAS